MPKQWHRLEIPESGIVALSFPKTGEPLIVEAQREPLHPMFLTFLALLIAAAFLAFEPLTAGATAITLLTCGAYFSITLGIYRGLDVGGHLQHIERVVKDGWLVNANLCWECFHPPIYYVLASLALLRPSEIWPAGGVALQGLTLLLHALCVPLVMESFRLLGKRGRSLLLYTLLVVLWPAGVLASVRLGNDGLLNFTAFLVLYLLLRKQWWLAATSAALALLVKSSAIVMVAVTVTWLARSHLQKELSRRVLLGSLAILALGFLLGGLSARLKSYDSARLDALPGRLAVHNTFDNLFVMNPVTFISSPFVNPWIPTSNRTRLPNYFWKTSLFGEWTYDFPGATETARWLSTILVALLLLSMALFLRSKEKALCAPLLLFSFSAILAYRFLHPFACNADFRFVYPPVAFALAWILASESNRNFQRAAQLITLLFLSASQTFFFLLWLHESH